MYISYFAIIEHDLENLTLLDCYKNPILFYMYMANRDLNLNVDSIIIITINNDIDNIHNRPNYDNFILNEIVPEFKNSIFILVEYNKQDERFVYLNSYLKSHHIHNHYLYLNDIGNKVYNYIIKKYTG